MGWITISGPVTGVKELEDVAHNKYLSFRIGSRPVISYMKMNLMENDLVTAVTNDAPEPQIEALRNDKTKVEYLPHEPKVSFPIFGIIFGIILIPFFFIGIGVLWFTWVGYTGLSKDRAKAIEIKRILNSSK